MDTRTPTGTLMLTVSSDVAQFERERMLERQCEGIACAKATGKHKGSKPIAAERRIEVVRLAETGLTKVRIAQKLGLCEASVYRILTEAKIRKM